MSRIPIFPEEKGTSSSQLKKEEREEHSSYKHPDLIIDDRPDNHQEDKTNRLEEHEPRNPLSLRFFCFWGLAFCLIFGSIMVCCSLVLTLIALCSLFQNHNLNQSLHSFWKICLHTLVVGFGFTLGILSPTLGLSLIALYFSLSGEVIDNDLLRKIIRRSFNNF